MEPMTMPSVPVGDRPGEHIGMDSVFERAAAWGLEAEFRDAFGTMRRAEPGTLARILESFPKGPKPAAIVPGSIVLRDGRERRIPLELPAGVPVRWTLSSESRVIAAGEAVSPSLTLPVDLPRGILRLEVEGPPGGPRAQASVVVCPARASQGAEDAPDRMWALAVQLYGVRSVDNWGHGDFDDLESLIDLAAEIGAAGIALNPLHALFDDHPEHCSPYAPNSRLFLNPLYINVARIPEFPGVTESGLHAALQRLRAQAAVDDRAVAEIKRSALRRARDAFRRFASAERRAAFDRFRQERGVTLASFAAFEALRRRFKGPWWEWPPEWRHPNASALDHLRIEEADEVDFCEFVQWVAHEQLDGCRARAAACGLPLGLYLDIAVGVRSDGFDAWYDQAAFLPQMSIGAPPDILNPAGQGWGLAALSPAGLEEGQFAPVRRMLAASMRYAGAIRLDHVLGLKRLYVIPSGMSPAAGAYVRFPFEALLGVTALLSAEHDCIVIGEDLGTVPEHFRETLADWGLWSYQVMLFERAHDGSFHAPESYRHNALATFATHDLPTFAGWKSKHDLATKEAIGVDPGETREERDAAVQALSRSLQDRGMECDFEAVVRFLADTPSRLLVIAMEDVLGVTEQVNVPGTVDEHPNWRRRLPVGLEELRRHAGLRSLAQALKDAGRAQRPVVELSRRRAGHGS